MKFLTLYLLLIPFILPAQDITGIWIGYVHTSDKHLPYEVVISEDNGKLRGYSHITFFVSGSEMIAVKTLKIKSEYGKFILEDEDLIFNNFRDAQPKKMRQSSVLILTIEDTAMTLSGPFSTNKTRDLRPANGDVMLQKKFNHSQTKLLAKLDQMSLSENLSFLKPKTIPDDIAIVTADVKPKVFKEETIKSEAGVKNIEIPAQPEEKNNNVMAIVLQRLEPPPVELKSKRIAITPNPVIFTTEPLVLQPKLKERRIITPPAESVIQPKPLTSATTAAVRKPVPIQPKIDKSIAVNKPVPQNKIPVPNTQPVKPITIPVVKRDAEIVSTGSAADITKRKIETIESVSFKTDSLVLSLYDNGEVDGDTVSVLINGRIIIGKQGLTTNAFNTTIYITPEMGDSLQLIMYAENLGSLPPNTGLLIIQDGNERHEIRFAGDLQKNAAILLRRSK